MKKLAVLFIAMSVFATGAAFANSHGKAKKAKKEAHEKMKKDQHGAEHGAEHAEGEHHE